MAQGNAAFALLQKTGKSLMLPVSVLPVAGILLGVGSAHFSWLPAAVSDVMAQSGGAIFGNLVGSIAGWLFNKYFRIQLPPYLGFFAGKRFVPIVTALACIAAGVVLSLIWPPIGRGIDVFSRWAASENPGLAFAVYGVVERALIPFGLHHIWNVPFFFEVGQYLDPTTGSVIRGEINRFVAGDRTAGLLAGGYLFKMWGVPA